MKLTDEQKDEIREAIETQGGIYSEYGLQKIRRNGIDWLLALLKSEQAWKEEAERLQAEIESHAPEGRNYTNQQYVDLLLKFNQAVKVLKEVKVNSMQARHDDRISGGFQNELEGVIDSFLSSLSREGDWINERCPKCNAQLLGNTQDKWCSHTECDYGLSQGGKP